MVTVLGGPHPTNPHCAPAHTVPYAHAARSLPYPGSRGERRRKPRMASRFVSSGAIDPTSGAHVESAEAQPSTGPGRDAKAEIGGKNKEAWEAVQREVEEERKRRAAEKGSAEGEKSLYEILQENKGMNTHPSSTPPSPHRALLRVFPIPASSLLRGLRNGKNPGTNACGQTREKPQSKPPSRRRRR